MPIDLEVLTRKINLINKDLKQLFILCDLSLAKYLKNDANEVLVERYLERIIGRMIDINYHILATEHNETPHDFYQSFILMAKYKYLSADFAEKVAKSAGLRNRLAHEYDAIDPKKVYKAATVSLQDVPKYLTSIVKLMDKIDKRKKLF